MDTGSGSNRPPCAQWGATLTNIRSAVETSRERLVALTLLLQSATGSVPINQERILRELTVDEYPISAKGPRKVRAYEGSEGAVRQKFERDKARIRELGFQIETVVLDDGSVGYWIEPDSMTAPTITFSEVEERVVQLALQFCGFGASGAFSLFNPGPATDGGLEFSNFYNPVLRAMKLHRVLSFDYQSSVTKERIVEPLHVGVFAGATYLVARVKGTIEVKGYRFSRMTSMPFVLDQPFDVDDALLEVARAWRPEFTKPPSPVDVTVSTNDRYAELLLQELPSAVVAKKKSGRVEVGITFESQRAAMRFLFDAADRVRLEAPKSLKVELRTWLEWVNRGSVPSIDTFRFESPTGNDVLGQTLQLLHAVYQVSTGLRISELATRFDLEPSLIRHIMDRLVTFEPMNGAYGFPAHVIKDCDDWDDEENDDSTYRAEFYGLSGSLSPSALTWRDLFELNVALREASRVYRDPALHSAIEKIEAVVGDFMSVEAATDEPTLAVVQAALLAREQIKIEYVSGTSGESQLRSIEPRDIRVLNGRTYVRAYCGLREGWRTFRVDRIRAVLAKSPASEDRPADVTANWLTQVGEEGDEVIVVLESHLRWLFEPLPNAQWTPLDDGRFAVKFRVSDQGFLDNLLVHSGRGAVVATPAFARSGHDLAARMAQSL